MSLEKTFQKVEKLPEEKKLEVITNKETILNELESYFEKNKREVYSLHSLEENKKFFSSCMKFLESFKLSPEIITEFNARTENITGITERQNFSVYLSTMIQTSYNKGFNNFTFEEVNSVFFGAYLKGQPKKPIKITTKELKGGLSLFFAENCSLTAETIEGELNLDQAKNCSLTTKTLKGNFSLFGADGCLAEITNYQGITFGFCMKNSIIKSENEKTLETIKMQGYKGENNKFELK